MFVCIQILSCATSEKKFDSRAPAQVPDKPRHLLVFIHGIGGTLKTFGEMPTLLTGDVSQGKVGQLSIANPTYDWRSLVVQYPTGSGQYTTYNFAEMLGQQIQSKFADRPISSEDRISIIGHSQGGVIAAIWLILSLSEVNDFYKQQAPYAKAIDSMITVSTPFWGSGVANLGIAANDISKNIISNLPTQKFRDFSEQFLRKRIKIGEAELKELSFGSDTIFRFRQRAIELSEKQLQTKIRFLSIGGVFPRADSQKFSPDWKKGRAAAWSSSVSRIFYQKITAALEKKLSQNERVESDSAVSISSSRPDFIYTQALNENYIENELTPLVQTKRTSYFHNRPGAVDFVPIESVHANFFSPQIYDIVDVPEICKDPHECDHASYRFIARHLLDNCFEKDSGCNLEQTKNFLISLFNKDFLYDYYHPTVKKELKSFAIDFNIKVPEDYSLPTLLKKCSGSMKNCLALKDVLSTKVLSEFYSKYEIYWLMRSWAPTTAVFVDKIYKNNSGAAERHLRIHLSGKVQPKQNQSMMDRFEDLEEGLPISIKLALPNLKSREIETRVRPTFTTFVDTQLAP